MAATNGHHKAPTVGEVLRRADRRWADRHKDEPANPAYLAHLETYLTPVAGPLNDSAPTADLEAENLRLREQVTAAERNAAGRRAALDQVRAELADAHTQIERLRAELADAVDTHARDLAEVARLRAELEAGFDQIRGQRDGAMAEEERLLAENDQLRTEASAAMKLIGQLRADYDTVQAERDRLAEQLAAATAHVCRYPWPDPEGSVQPCSCGRPYPRYVRREVDDVEPDVEPWSAVFDRLRAELEDLT